MMTNTNVAVRNVADPEQIASAERKEKHRGDILRQDINFLISSPSGRRILSLIMYEAGVYSRGKPGSSEDAFFRAGKRDLAMTLMERIISVDPDGWVKLMQEDKQTEARNG